MLTTFILLVLQSAEVRAEQAPEVIEAAETVKAVAEQSVEALDPKIVITQAEGYSRLIAPMDPKKAVVGTRAMVEGKMVQVIEAAPGIEVPDGSVVQTFEGKVKMALPSGDAFIASRATEVEMNLDKVAKGKAELNVELKRGLLRGVVQQSEKLSVNVVTDQFKAKVAEAEFVTGTLKSADPKAAAEGAVMKMVQGSAQLAPLQGLQGKLIEAKAGADVVFGLKSADLVPMLKEKAMMQATALNPEKLLTPPPELQESLALLNNTSAALESKLDQMIEPEEDCGCPSLEQRLKRQALKTAKSFAQNKREKQESAERQPDSEVLAQGGINPEGQASSESDKNAENEADQEHDSALAKLANSKDLACLSPVIEQLQGAAQIISSLKDGIFSSKEAKPGSCVSKNSTFKSFIESRAKLKFPNGDELLSGDNVNMALDWTKDQLRVNLNEGSIRGAFNEAAGKTVQLQADGLNAVTKGGDLALSAKNSAQDAVSSAASAGAAAAGSATSLASGLLSGVGGALSGVAGSAAGAAAGAAGSAGAVLSVFDGAAKVGSKVVEAGSQIAAESAKPVKIPEEQIENLKSETEPLKKVAKAAKTPLRPSPTHPSPSLEGLELSDRQPEEALIRRYLDPTL